MRLFLDRDIIIPQSCNLLYAGPSHGNVGQMALDLLISTLKSEKESSLVKIGYIESKYLIPMIGLETYESNGRIDSNICMPMELYINETKRYFIVLQRSPCRNEYVKAFIDELFFLVATELQCKSWYVVTGAKPLFNPPNKLFLRHNKHINIPSEYFDVFSLQYQNLGENVQKSPLQGESVFTNVGLRSGTSSHEQSPMDSILNMRIANEILLQSQSLQAKYAIGVAVLGCLCQEGDNMSDAKELLNGLNLLEPFKLSSINTYVNQPDSWKVLYDDTKKFSFY